MEWNPRRATIEVAVDERIAVWENILILLVLQMDFWGAGVAYDVVLVIDGDGEFQGVVLYLPKVSGIM